MRKIEDQPRVGSPALGFQPATLNTPPSSWIAISCAAAVTPSKRVIATKASLALCKDAAALRQGDRPQIKRALAVTVDEHQGIRIVEMGQMLHAL